MSRAHPGSGGSPRSTRSLGVESDCWDRGAPVPSTILGAGSGEATGRQRLEALAGEDAAISFTSSRALKAKVLEIFDSTFVVARALELIAILGVVPGVFNVLWASVLSRRRGVGVLGA